MMEYRKWVTRDGRVLDVRDMSDEHVRNALRILYLLAEVMELRVVLSMSACRGEMAQDAAAWEASRIGERTPTQTLLSTAVRRRAVGLVIEWRRRGYPRDSWRADGELSPVLQAVADAMLMVRP